LQEARRVEIFDVIEANGTWLMFQPLDRLYGVYRRVGEVTGIAINAQHPPSLQRYTAAHELGHHVLGHGFSLDEVHNVDGARGIEESEDFDNALAARSSVDVGDPTEEAAAQAFAATFLMPIQAFNRVLLDLHFDRDRPALEPEDVYRLSLEFGTSYEATVTQLAVLDKITWPQARGLRLPPIRIKTALAGQPLENSRADVWLIEETVGERRLPLRVADEVIVRLEEIPSSGYGWELDTERLGPLELLDRRVVAGDDDPDLYGAAARREIHLRATAPGDAMLRLALARPWEDDPPLQTVAVNVIVAESPTGDAPQGLVRSQQLQRMSA
jgi:Zn-dependent peptidase ImmA (M78 family)/predicted secreted protein